MRRVKKKKEEAERISTRLLETRLFGITPCSPFPQLGRRCIAAAAASLLRALPFLRYSNELLSITKGPSGVEKKKRVTTERQFLRRALGSEGKRPSERHLFTLLQDGDTAGLWKLHNGCFLRHINRKCTGNARLWGASGQRDKPRGCGR